MAIMGSQFAQVIESLSGPQREVHALALFYTGEVPSFMRLENFLPVAISHPSLGRLVIRVSPDVFSIGTDTDFVRMPLWPISAQRAADSIGAILPSRKLSKDIYDAASIKLSPSPIAPGPAMTLSSTFATHNQTVQNQLSKIAGYNPKTSLVAGHKKDVVIGPRLDGSKVAIYGWHQSNGQAIQPYSTIHEAEYSDYSHGIRLIGKDAMLNGKSVSLTEIFMDPVKSALVSDQGPFEPRFPNAASTGPASVGGNYKQTGADVDAGSTPTQSVLTSAPALIAIGLVGATLMLNNSPKRRR